MKKSILCAAAILAAGTICCNMGTQILPVALMTSPLIASAAEEAVGNLIVNISGLTDLSGVTITVTGNGKTYTSITDTNGQAVFSKLPVNGSDGNAITYTIKETIPDGYMAASSMTTTLSAGATVIASIPNMEKTYTIAIDCADYITGSTQPSGDAVLSGGSYTVYHDGEAYGTYSIASDGTLCEFTLHGNEYEGEWAVQMDEAPTGYYLDSTMQELGYYEGDVWTPLNSYFPQYTHATMHLSLVPISGRISVAANSGDQLQIYLKSSDSFDHCRSSERAQITIGTDSKSVTTESLPFGTYVVDDLTTGKSTTVKITEFGSVTSVDLTDTVTTPTAKCTVRFMKKTDDPIGSAVFIVLDKEENEVYRFSSTSGSVEIPDLVYGETYTIREIMAPDGYEKTEEGDIQFTAAENTVITVIYQRTDETTTGTTTSTTETTTSTTESQYISVYRLYDQSETTLISSGIYVQGEPLEMTNGMTAGEVYLLQIEKGDPYSEVGTALHQMYIVLNADGTYTTYHETSGKSIYGDINLDGRVDITDAVLLNKAAAGTVKLNEQATQNSDCDGDGTLSTGDSVSLLKFLVHLVTSLPSES